ncbi:hypothetical protein AWE29_22510, partial [Escherichia coli]
FEDDGEGGLTAMHHPFTSPKDMTAAELKAAPENAVANAYDMVPYRKRSPPHFPVQLSVLQQSCLSVR